MACVSEQFLFLLRSCERGSPPLPFLVTCGTVRACVSNVWLVLDVSLCCSFASAFSVHGFLFFAHAGSVLLLCLVHPQRDIHKTSTCSQHSDEPHADFVDLSLSLGWDSLGSSLAPCLTISTVTSLIHTVRTTTTTTTTRATRATTTTTTTTTTTQGSNRLSPFVVLPVGLIFHVDASPSVRTLVGGHGRWRTRWNRQEAERATAPRHVAA